MQWIVIAMSTVMVGVVAVIVAAANSQPVHKAASSYDKDHHFV